MEEANVPEQAQPNTFRQTVRVIWEYVWTLGLMALVVFSARSSLVDWYEVPSGSMLPTIQEGDRIFVNKLAFDLRVPFTFYSLKSLGEPRRGDIVVFVWPEDNRTDYVKRLIGLPGDTVEVRDNVVYVNGEPFSRRPTTQSQLPAGAASDPMADLYLEKVGDMEHFAFERRTDSYGPFTVPEGQYFMMGDNRDNSSDSREWGTVPRANLRGRALRVVLSFDRTVPWSKFWKRPRWERSFLSLKQP